MTLTIPSEVTEALKDVRDDTKKLNFAVVGYDEEDPKALALFGMGDSGVEGLKSHLKENDVAYCLLRVDFNYETVGVIKADATKFIFIYFRPESTPLKRKMTLGTVEGRVKKVFSPFIRTYEVDSLDQLSEEKISEMIDTVTMTKNNVTEKKGNGMLIGGRMVNQRSNDSDKTAAQMSSDSRAQLNYQGAKGADVKFTDEDKLTECIRNVRDDTNPLRWCLFSYADKKNIEFTAEGEGDVSELLSSCTEDKVSYGLFRFTENYGGGIDQVKFGFVTWAPDTGSVSPIMKALVSTHKGEVVTKFRPFHVQFYVQSPEELTEEIALNTISSLTGTKSHVTDKKPVKKEDVYERKMLGGAVKETQKLVVVNEEALKEEISNLRKDTNPEVGFVIAQFEGDKKSLQLNFVSSGTGLEAGVELLNEDTVQYMLLRTKGEVDGYQTTKFVLVKYDGDNVGIGYKGACGVYHGAVTNLFGAVHTSAELSGKEEILNRFA